MKVTARYSWVATLLLIGGCATPGSHSDSSLDNSPGRATTYVNPGSQGRGIVNGIGIESNDIVSMTDQMVRDMLSNRLLAARTTPARIVIDAKYFRNESSSRVNKNMITDRLRIELNRAAHGRIIFVGRHYSDMVEKERALKRQGTVDAGTIRHTQATAGADFRLGGRITSLDAISKKTGAISRYHQISFEMVDLEYGTIAWSGIYEFKKTAQDDVIYR